MWNSGLETKLIANVERENYNNNYKNENIQFLNHLMKDSKYTQTGTAKRLQ